MFKELTYFQYLNEDMKILQQQSNELNALLTEAYSPPNKLYCSLKEQIDNILNQQNQLQDVVSVILQQIASATLVPLQIEPHQLSQMFLNSLVLPQWFPHVLQTEYGKYKAQLDIYAKNLAAMHSLQQKRKAMREERQNLETLYRRTLAISALQKNQHFSDIDIMQDVNHLRNRVKNVRKTFQYFCSQIASKVREFIESLIDKTIHFSKGQNPQKKNASDIFKNCQNNFKVQYYDMAQAPVQSFKRNERPTYISPNKINISSKIKPQKTKQHFQNYYNHAEKIIQNHPLVPTKPHPIYNYGFASACRNHEDMQSTHRHTCSKGKDWLRSAKSQQRLTSNYSPRHFLQTSRKYDYRRVVAQRGSDYF